MSTHKYYIHKLHKCDDKILKTYLVVWHKFFLIEPFLSILQPSTLKTFHYKRDYILRVLMVKLELCSENRQNDKILTARYVSSKIISVHFYLTPKRHALFSSNKSLIRFTKTVQICVVTSKICFL